MLTLFSGDSAPRYPPQPTAHRFASGDSSPIFYFLFSIFLFYDPHHSQSRFLRRSAFFTIPTKN